MVDADGAMSPRPTVSLDTVHAWFWESQWKVRENLDLGNLEPLVVTAGP
jgi:hypothetical protein